MASILPIPPLPDGLKEAVNREKLAVFVGAGASRVMGCMGWGQLASDLVSACHQAGYINYKERETLAGDSDHRKTITICHHVMAEREGNPDLFFAHLERALQPNEDLARRYPIYEEVYKLRAVSVTTNADELFTRFFNPEAVVCWPEQFPGAVIDRTKLYHLHGIIRERQSLVFRLEQYIRHYRNTRIKQFLETLFKDFTILFVGYGLGELELLEYLVLRNSSDVSVLRHYYLMPMYQGEEHILEFQQAYYGRLGIQVVAYDITATGHSQLYHVIHEWQDEINRVTSALLNTYEYIEKAVSQYDEDTAGRLLQLIRHDKPYEDHFFKHVSGPDWLISLRERGYFEPSMNPRPVELKDNPGFVTVPNWNVLAYLERVAGQLDPADSDHYRALMGVVRQIADYRDEAGKRVENFRTDYSFIRVLSKVPASYLEPGDMDRVAELLKVPWGTSMVDAEIGISLLPHLIASGNEGLLAGLFAVSLGYRWETRQGREEPVPLIDEYWLGELLKRHLASIVNLIPVTGARTAIRIIEEIASRDPWAFHAPIRFVGNLELDTGYGAYERFVTRVARDCLVSGADRSPKETQEVVRELFRKDHPIFKRLALFTTSTKWEVLSAVFWEVAGAELLADYSLDREIRHLEETRYADFSDTEKERWLDWIESAPCRVPEHLEADTGKRADFLARQKLRHLAAIKDTGHARTADLYHRYVGIVGAEPQAEELDVWGGPVTIVPESGKHASELLRMSIPAIVKSLKGESGQPRKLDFDDMALAFREAVKAAPERFVKDLAAFADVPHNCHGSLLGGLREAWKGGASFEWGPILSFCQDLILEDAFWLGYDSDRAGSQVVSEVADLIWEGTVTDLRAFDRTLLPLAEDILLELFVRTPTDVEGWGDLQTAVLNSSRGRVIRALMSYSLRVARLQPVEAPEGERWATRVKAEFARRLGRSVDDSLEYYFSLGEFLGHIYYLDRRWVVDNINLIFPKDNDRHWKAAFSGYLCQARFYKDFYSILRGADHYSKALDTSFEGRHLGERLVHHVCLAYLEGIESLGDPESLFEKLLSRWDPDVLSEVVRFFWMQRRDGLAAEHVKKVLAFWQHLFEHYEPKEAQLAIDEKKLVSSLSKLSVYLEKLDDRLTGWLKLSGKCSEAGHDSPFLVEQLDRLAEVSPRQVADVFIVMLENGVFPDYDMGHIVSCVEKLYGAGERNRANIICNLYLSRRFENFRDIFKRHNE